jgi:hypothetical protein
MPVSNLKAAAEDLSTDVQNAYWSCRWYRRCYWVGPRYYRWYRPYYSWYRPWYYRPWYYRPYYRRWWW